MYTMIHGPISFAYIATRCHSGPGSLQLFLKWVICLVKAQASVAYYVVPITTCTLGAWGKLMHSAVVNGDTITFEFVVQSLELTAKHVQVYV